MKKYLFVDRINFLFVCISSSLAGISNLILVFLLQFVFRLTENRNFDKIGTAIILTFIGATIIFIVLSLAFRMRVNYLSKIMIHIQNDLYSALLRKNISEFNEFNTSHYLSMFNNDLTMIKEKYFKNIFVMITDSTQLLLAILYASFIDIKITLLLLVFGFIFLLVPKMIIKNAAHQNSESMREIANYNNLLKDSLDGFYLIKEFLAETEFKDNHERIVNKTQFSIKKAEWEIALANYLVQLVNVISQLSLFLSFSYFVFTNKIDIAVFFTLFSLTNSVFSPIIYNVENLNMIKSTKEIRKKIIDLIETEDKEDNLIEVNQFKEEIDFANVYFAYENKPVLKNISLTLEKGKKYALIGESGSGKSTIINLLLKINEGYQGTIQIDIHELKDIQIQSLFQIISVIPQNVFIFNDTLLNKFMYVQKIDMKEVESAVQKAGLSDKIKQLEKGYFTVMSENGSNFSGGEKQRIAIARAYLHHAQVLLLDEPISSLDNVTALQVENEVLDSEFTSLMITHRYYEETLSRYDEIFILKDGKICAKGNYSTLKSCPEFIELLQSA